MRLSIKKGCSFGMTSGVITTLGLIVGLHSSTNSDAVVMGGILVIAVADAMSDALGIHISEEAKNEHSAKEVWETTISTFLSKFLTALVFIVPFLLLPLLPAIMASVFWGMALIVAMSYKMAKEQGVKPYSVVSEHLFIAVLVILITHFIGDWVAALNA